MWWWAVAAALALLTHYFAAFLVVPEGLYLAWVCRAVVAPVLVGLVGAALIPLAAHERSKIGTGYIEGVSLRRRVIGVPEDFLTGFVVKFDTTREQVLDAFALVVAGVGALLGVQGVRRWPPPLALCAAGIPLLLAIGGADFFNTRNVIAGCVPALIVVAAGLRRGVVILCAIGLACVVLVAADSTFHRENWRGIAEAMGPARATRVVVVPPVSGEVGLGVQVSGLSRMPAGGAAVSEVDIGTPRSTLLGGPMSGRPARPLPPAVGFRLAEKRYAEDFTLLRWVAPRPVHVTAGGLAVAARGVVYLPVALVQPPGR